MKKSQYLSLKADLEDQLQRAQATADSIRRRLDALNVVWSELLCPSEQRQEAERAVPVSNGEAAPETDNPAPANTDPVTNVPAVSGDTIDQIALSMSGDFTVQDVVRHFVEKGQAEPNRSTVSGRLTQLFEEGRLDRVTKGQGRQPSVFRRKGEAA